ncbi:hypothetical protein RCIP0014_00018 [Klebsiella phage RCIP0014]
MYKLFKVGDKVVRKPHKDNSTFEMHQGVFNYYTITSISKRGCWLQLDNFTDRGKDPHPWYVLNFELYQEPDEELPPVPRSVSYLKDDGRLKLEVYNTGSSVTLLLSLRKVSTLGYSLDPDAALQLAHDLNRMANEIKRKQKRKA